MYFFTARRYASAVYAVVAFPSVRPSIRLSQAGIVQKRLDESSWVLAWKLNSTYPTLCYKEIWVSTKIRILLSGTLSQTQDLENFAMGREREREKNIHHKANNRCDNQNKFMWQAAREEISI